MGFYAEDYASLSVSGLTIGQAIYEVALIIAVLRWVLCLLFRVIKDTRTTHSSSWDNENDNNNNNNCYNRLALTTFGEIVERLPQTEDTCAVCLNHLNMEDEVRELMNCYHVFHRECIDKWLEHDNNDNNNTTCPLCRAPCYGLHASDADSCGSSSSLPPPPPPPQPNWAVERLLYLFGDDLLPYYC